MLELYWGCLIGGVIFTVVALLIGDMIGGHGDVGHPDIGGGEAGHAGFGSHDAGSDGHGWHLDVLKPAVVVGAITAFGGAGIMLNRYSTLSASWVLPVAIAIAAVMGALIYLLYIRPLRNAESSIGYSINDLVGRTCEVSVAIPEIGYGEVLVPIGNGLVNHTATGDGALLPRGSKAVVVAVEQGVLVVAPLELDESTSQQPPLLSSE